MRAILEESDHLGLEDVEDILIQARQFGPLAKLYEKSGVTNKLLDLLVKYVLSLYVTRL